MKYRLITLLFLLSLIALPLAAAAQSYDPSNPPEKMYEIVVELNRDQSPEKYAPYFLSQVDVPADEVATRVHHVYKTAIVGFSVYLTAYELEKAQRVFADGPTMGVKSISQSSEFSVPEMGTTEIDSQIPSFKIEAGTQIVPTGIQRIQAGPAPDGVNFGAVDVAVIDTGVDKNHPDLNVVGGYDCTAASGEEGDFGHDGYGHGTHVAGTIAAEDGGIGVIGVAPGARIWSVKVLNDMGMGSTASVICGIDWVAEHSDEIDVANMSLGGLGFKTECNGSDPMHNSICVATESVVFVVAAGNSSQDASGFSPANYDEVVSVSAYADFDGQAGGAGIPPQNNCFAMSTDDSLAPFSNYGPDVDIAAPGVCITSTLPGIVDEDGVYTPQYGTISGTSMSSPHVAGAIARYLAQNPDQKDVVVQQVLTWSAANNPPVTGDRDGGYHEPLLFIGSGAPRYEASPSDAAGT